VSNVGTFHFFTAVKCKY